MSMTNDMTNDLVVLITRAILVKDDDIRNRLNTHEDALRELKCTDPELGKWIAVCDLPFLIETMVLSDAVFSEEFPGVKLSAEERKRFAHALEGHCETCAHCHLKRAYDLELQSRVKRAFAENKQAVSKAIARAAGEQ